MSTEVNKALVRRYYAEVLNQRNIAVLDELCSPTFVSQFSTGPAVGLAQFRQGVIASHTAFPDLHVTVQDQIADGDKVVTRWMAQGAHQGPFAGIPPTGKRVTVTAIHIHRVTNGKLIEHWEEINLLGLMQQLGVIPT